MRPTPFQGAFVCRQLNGRTISQLFAVASVAVCMHLFLPCKHSCLDLQTWQVCPNSPLPTATHYFYVPDIQMFVHMNMNETLMPMHACLHICCQSSGSTIGTIGSIHVFDEMALEMSDCVSIVVPVIAETYE